MIQWSEKTEEYYLHCFTKEQPDLNWELEEVRDAVFKESITFWLERGVDGFRIDSELSTSSISWLLIMYEVVLMSPLRSLTTF